MGEGRLVGAGSLLRAFGGERTQDVADRPEVQFVGDRLLPVRLAQHGCPCEERQVVPAHVQRTRVPVQRFVGITGFEKQVRLGVIHVDQAGDVVDQVESLDGGLYRAFLEEHLAEVDEDLRRQFLAKADQAATVGELPLRIARARGKPRESAVRGRQRDQLAQDGWSTDPGFGERVLDGTEFGLGVADLLRDVPEQRVEIELVVVGGDPLQDDALGPAEGPAHRGGQFLGKGAGADHVDDAVDGDHELGVVGRVFGDVLEDRHRVVAPARGLHQVGHQKQVVAVFGMQHQGAPVARDGLVAEPAQGVDAGFELPAHTCLVEFAQFAEPALDLGEPVVRFLGQVVGEHVEHDVLDVFEFVLRVCHHELAQYLVVGIVVGKHHVDTAELAQAVRLAGVAVPGEVLDHFRGGQMVPDFGVDTHQEADLVAVRLLQDELFLEVHDNVAQGVELGREQQELAFREAPPGGAFDAQPELTPGFHRIFLAAGNAVEPRKPHPLVVAESAFAVPQSLEDADGRLGSV